MDVCYLLALCEEFALHHQAHERLSAYVEEWTLEESEEHPDAGIQHLQDEGGQKQMCGVGTVKIRRSGFLRWSQCSWVSMFLFGGRVNYFVRALNDDFSQCHQSFHLSPLVLHFLLYSPADGSAHQHSHWCLNEELRWLCWIWGGLQHPQVNGQRLEAWGIMGSFSFFIFSL